jgi:predicted transcriptional regulator
LVPGKGVRVNAEQMDRQVPRRGPGELERAVLTVLWSADSALSPGEVRDRLTGGGTGELSYSTVVTILSRLHDKGVLLRKREGRSFRYSPVVADVAGLAARQLNDVLDQHDDRAAVLTRFVADLSDKDEELLRRLLRPAPDPSEG